MKHPGLGVIKAVFEALDGNLSYDGSNVPVYSSMPQGVEGYYVYLSAIRNTEDYTKTVFGGRVRFDVKITAPMLENTGTKIGLYDIASQVTNIMRPTREGNLALDDDLSNRMIYQEDSREIESLTPEGMVYEVVLSYVVEYDEIPDFKPIVFKVLPVDDTTNLSVSTSSGLCTWKFYSGGSLDNEYIGTNSVNHTWDSVADRYFEFYPPDNDYESVTDFDFFNGLLFGNPQLFLDKLVNVTNWDFRGGSFYGEITLRNTDKITNVNTRAQDLFINNSRQLFQSDSLETLSIEFSRAIEGIPENIDTPSLRFIRSFNSNLYNPKIPEGLFRQPSIEDVIWYNMSIFGIEVTTVSPTLNVIHLHNNRIEDSSQINDLLIACDVAGLSTASIRLEGGTNAAPTGAGITAKNNLIARGCTVITN